MNHNFVKIRITQYKISNKINKHGNYLYNWSQLHQFLSTMTYYIDSQLGYDAQTSMINQFFKDEELKKVQKGTDHDNSGFAVETGSTETTECIQDDESSERCTK